MKRFLPTLTALSLCAAMSLPALADVAKPNVREGDFFCFRGMPSEQLNILPAAPERNRPQMRVDKLGNSKFDNTDGHDLREIPTEGDYNVLVILVEFQDVKLNRQWGAPQTTVDNMLNSEDFTFQGATGSVNNYFQRISGGKFNPKFDVAPPVLLSKKEIEYVTSNPDDKYIDAASGQEITCYPAGRMVEEALKALEGSIDFSKYDSDGDGTVDFVYIFFAGQGATTGGDRYHNIWPHAYTLTAAIGAPVEVGGLKVNRYCTSSELGTNRKLSGIGTFCHEFSHVLGLPDLYDTKNNNGTVSPCFSPGSFSNMDAGNYNNSEHTPPFFSVYEQYAMEWMKPASLSGTGHYTLLPLEARPYGYQLFSPNNPQEYFILEARGNSFLDRHLSGHGLLVWHIDFNLPIWQANTVNNVASHQRIDLIEADNLFDESTRSGDPFPGVSGICEYTKNVTPAFKDWKGTAIGYDLREITYNFDGTVSFEGVTDYQMDAEAALAAPALRIAGASADALQVEWAPVENATEYYISVFDADKFNGSVLPFDAYFNGWYYKNVGLPNIKDGKYVLELNELPSNANCGIMIYAVNDLNASRAANPVFVSTVDGKDFNNAATNIRLYQADNSVIAEWDAVENADDYEMLIVKREKGAMSDQSEKLNFDRSMMPETWTESGTAYDNRKYGESSPSVTFQQPGSFLQSPIYDEQIASINFWACKRYRDDLCDLAVYALDKSGKATLVKDITDLTREGGNYSLDMPAQTYGVRFVHNYRTTELHAYIDDLVIEFHAGHIDTPVEEAEIQISDNTAVVNGLKEGEDYLAYVYPLKEGERGKKSNEISFRVEDIEVSGVETLPSEPAGSVAFTSVGLQLIPNDANAAYDVYATDGTQLLKNTKGTSVLPARGIYLIRNADGKTIKMAI